MKVLACAAMMMLLFYRAVNAQDTHFSQYFASPLTINPAATGFFDGNYRIAANERQQWWNVGNNYNTTSITGDTKIFKDRIAESDIMGIGFNGVFDRSLNGALQSTFLSVSGAYHKLLSDRGNQSLGVGLQATFANRYFDLSRVSFASQFNIDQFDPTIPVNIDYYNNATKYFSLNVGVLYSFYINGSGFYIGGALYHLNRPVESLFNSSGDVLPFRETIHTGGDIKISRQSSVLYSGVYMEQGGIKDQMIGGAYGLKMTDDNRTDDNVTVYAGMWYRVNDSYIPYVSVDYNDISVGLNYSLPQTSIIIYRPNTVEISVVFRNKFSITRSARCPRL